MIEINIGLEKIELNCESRCHGIVLISTHRGNTMAKKKKIKKEIKQRKSKINKHGKQIKKLKKKL